MWTTDIIAWQGYHIYKVYNNGVLVSEMIEKSDMRHALSDLVQDVRTAAAVGLRDEPFPLPCDGENMHE
jgi:hypothetical protein